ncbi:glycosyltransferase involved in cell wall biosynthesis [Dysgonomonas sp. PFB1-18]|uniref:glycosyltransferase n=1 Tax=unclassified Dysgonomonas TaxID=2630389 RepID=UPI0024767072|nr:MULTISPECIES: glycosyltransferase [unclassified Dysgonomonas]MDH6307771.1 glycosyltransferase involved in cell wall biosynthesis [Dysgonomonas sp. PF1-14]MDH6337689.1 glycosyltransferase involved in cell wall biosynthesis [Dysgonomonas sp. PF1-16]MDH6378913.1 glycosyltransferase involved in cell wall biosynthesis [Dysgonomonas sp. PFB1-18]MDH6396548.1 glycosyltransferase involved in cell wall biosynthesis [Dysgonomonas sp. PF1-23]
MKIVRLTTFLDFGGIESRFVNLSHVKDDNNWLFCAINKGGDAERKIRKQNKSVYVFGLPYKIPSLITIWKLYIFFSKEKPDVVHTSGAEANFHGILAAKLAGVQTIVSEEIGIPTQSIVAKTFFNFIYKISDHIVGNSNNVVNYLIKENKVSLKKIAKIYNPIIFPPIDISREMHSKFCIVSVSRLEPVKNIKDVLLVIERLNAEGYNIHYTIVGDGSSKEVLENIVNKNKLDVIFAGYQSNPYPFFMNTDLFILNSLSEGFSNSLIEAMFSGTPSLSTTVGAAEEIIEDGYNGWLVPPQNQEALYIKIKHIMSLSVEERVCVGMKGHETALKYSLEEHINQLMDIYAKD